MPTISELWDKLPSFMKFNKVVRAEIKTDSDDMTAYGNVTPWKESAIDKGNMITSEINGTDKYPMHRPVLDLDYEAQLVPSSTPGHYHLMLDRAVSWSAYEKFLEAAAAAGIIQHGFYEGAKKRKASSVRLPWIKKGDPKANAMDPDAETKRIKAAIEYHRSMIKALESELDVPEYKVVGSLGDGASITFTYDPESPVMEILMGDIGTGLSVGPMKMPTEAEKKALDDEVEW